MSARTALAMVQTAPRRLEPRELAVPDLGADDALLRVEACGICGSDVESFEGVLKVPLPLVPGHEPLGRIEAIGERAAERWGVGVGDRVAVETLLACGACARCHDGSYQLCAARRIYSYIPLSEAPGLWGAYAEVLYLPPNAILHKVDPSLPAELAVLFNPLGAGFRWAVEMPRLEPGDTVLVMGPGQRGLASVIACREAGAGTILVTGLERDAHKLALARELGADHTLVADREDVRARVRELTGGRGADVVIEVTAFATEPVRDAVDCARLGGTVVLAGVKGMKAIEGFVSDKVVLKEVTIRGAIGVTYGAYERAIRLIESRRVPLERMQTHRFGLRDAERAIRTLAGEFPDEQAIHCCLLPGRG
ncbi:MAG TPA: zinc-binding dehydrogenase [Myxococcota bacterium]|nr:zinc-binding dehydrogenase [Myxococcota bacterium]